MISSVPPDFHRRARDIPAHAEAILRGGRTSNPPTPWTTLGKQLGCRDETAKRWARQLGVYVMPPKGGHRRFSVWAVAGAEDRLRQGWADPNESTSVTGRAITELTGISTNKHGVIGRARRLYLGPKATNTPLVGAAIIGRARRATNRPPPDSEIAALRKAAQEEAAERRAAIQQAPPRPPVRAVHTGPVRECCYPIGELRTPGFRFCCEPAEGSPYCEEHHALCHRPTARMEMAHAA